MTDAEYLLEMAALAENTTGHTPEGRAHVKRLQEIACKLSSVFCSACSGPLTPCCTRCGRYQSSPTNRNAPGHYPSGVQCYHYQPCSEGREVPGLDMVRCPTCPARVNAPKGA